MSIHFDDSLGAFVSLLADGLGKETVQAGTVLRDSSGYLAFIADAPLPDKAKANTEATLKARISAYCREGRTLLDPEQPGVSVILQQGRENKIVINVGKFAVQLIERRIVGQDWLTAPAEGWKSPEPARFVFASQKGGVGRSTALAVTAGEWARQGRKVLAVDLDLESPGIGNMLLNDGQLPEFGVLDWYVEGKFDSNNEIDDEFLSNMVAPGDFVKGKGLIDVAPAIGRVSQDHPGNISAKIALAYLESLDAKGEPLSFLAQTRILINLLSGLKRYDAILIDACAGLNETTAAAILGLGADVLLFGEDSPQTFASYRCLLAHLARFPRAEEDDWLCRLHMVHAKAPADAKRQEVFRDSAYKIFQELLYREKTLPDENDNRNKDIGTALTFPKFSLDEPTAPHFAWPVLSDSNYFQFNPLAEPALLTPALYGRTFEALISGMTEISADTVTETSRDG
ncbi:MAG: AAA family ATPase [Gammaproteobacteria bacterium]|nr:AAA family ATPase [Gammaproteobacteria bacterium]